MFVSPLLDQKTRTIGRTLKWIFPGVPAPSEHEIAPLTRSEFLDVIRTTFALFTLVPIVLAISTFLLQERALSKEYDWRHKKEAQDIMQTWDSRTSAQKAKIESFFRARYQSNQMIPITREDAIAIRKARAPIGAAAEGSPDNELWEVRVKLTELLNYFETVSTACIDDIADETILKNSLGGPMSDWHGYLKNYIAVANEQAEREIWKPYRELMERWYPENSPAGSRTQRWPMHGH